MSPTPHPSPTATPDISLGGYLAHRLSQLGVDHLFGLPGDYNLALLDEMTTADRLTWVGCTNELNAGYAADGYARVRGFGALLTTYGVGELSAINAVAGSYAEAVPVVQITGAPPTGSAVPGALLHHTLADGDFGHFERSYREVTATAQVLTPAAPHEQIDSALALARDRLRPVYLSVPADLVHTAVPTAPLELPLPRHESDPRTLAAFTHGLTAHLRRPQEAVVLAGHLLDRRDLRAEVRMLADLGLRTATLTSSKGVVDENHPAFLGTYIGALTQDERTRRAVEETPVLVIAGAVLSDLVTGLFSHQIDLSQAVVLDLHRAHIGPAAFPDIELRDSLGVLLRLTLDTAPAPQSDPLATADAAARRGGSSS